MISINNNQVLLNFYQLVCKDPGDDKTATKHIQIPARSHVSAFGGSVSKMNTEFYPACCVQLQLDKVCNVSRVSFWQVYMTFKEIFSILEIYCMTLQVNLFNRVFFTSELCLF